MRFVCTVRCVCTWEALIGSPCYGVVSVHLEACQVGGARGPLPEH